MRFRPACCCRHFVQSVFPIEGPAAETKVSGTPIFYFVPLVFDPYNLGEGSLQYGSKEDRTEEMEKFCIVMDKLNAGLSLAEQVLNGQLRPLK